MFVDRADELDSIGEKLQSDRFELIVIYGRRRIGKTRMVVESVKDLDHVFFLATESDNIYHFKQEVGQKVEGVLHSADDWESLLRNLKDRIIILDEFPNLITEDRTVLSRFQKIVDLHLASTRTKVILLGSSISMMTDQVLGYKSPLYGRRTSSMELGPLKFKHLKEFFPDTSWEERCRIFAITDGIPHYILKTTAPVFDWLENEIKRPDSFLREEVDFLLRYEFTDSRTYRRILEAISSGNNVPKDIKDRTGMKHSDLTPYLRNLTELKMVKREVPITENEGSRKGRYFITDNMMKFWFKFILPNRSAIQEDIFEVNQIKDEFNTYMGDVFERIARELVMDLNLNDSLPLRFNEAGRWWHKGDEIDLVCLNRREKKALLMEFKWQDLNRTDAERIIERTREKGALLGLNEYELHYGIVCKRSSFKDGTIFDLSDFDRI
ncbi:MAG: ATP-binding protein [Thermoplasmatota archaeon]